MRKVIVFTDGGSRGNPGPAAIGVVICDEKERQLKEYSQYLEETTNNVAEYEAIVFALKKIKALFGKKNIKNLEIEIKSDSELLINQLSGLYKILDKKIADLFIKVWNLKIDFGRVKFTLISRENNKEADRLANEALDNKDRIKTLDLRF